MLLGTGATLACKDVRPVQGGQETLRRPSPSLPLSPYPPQSPIAATSRMEDIIKKAQASGVRFFTVWGQGGLRAVGKEAGWPIHALPPCLGACVV